VKSDFYLKKEEKDMKEEFYRFLRGKKNLAHGTCTRMLSRMPKGIADWDEPQIHDYYFGILDKDYSATHKRQTHYLLKYWSEFRGYKGFDYKPPKNHVSRRRNVEIEDIWKLLEVIEDTRDLALILTAFYSGARPSELINLKMEDVDFDSSTIAIRNTKTYKNRTVPIHKKAMYAIRKYLATSGNTGPYLFKTKRGDGPLKIQTYQKILRIYSEKAGIKRVTPYNCRHSYATEFLANDGSLLALQELLGHSNVAMTSVYTHQNQKMLRKAYDKACPEF